MAPDPRLALNQLIAAFEYHFDAAQSGDERGLEAAESRLRDAFFTYDDVLFTSYDVELPFDLLDEETEDDYEEFLDDEDDEDDDILDILAN